MDVIKLVLAWYVAFACVLCGSGIGIIIILATNDRLTNDQESRAIAVVAAIAVTAAGAFLALSMLSFAEKIGALH